MSIPSAASVRREDEYLQRRQHEFRRAAEEIARRLGAIPQVTRVVLFGSVARPLTRGLPRFTEFRRAGIELLHECVDVDLAVWLEGEIDLREVQRACTRALDDLLRESNIGVARHHVDTFLLDHASGRYLGRLCDYNACPKGKPSCAAPGCGATPFLKQIEDFTMHGDALSPEKATTLFERGGSLAGADG